jgi:arginine-tRNA-protein transferase
VSSPPSPSTPSCGYGSFQQLYWLGQRLVAVGVIDVLPRCVSSVYCYWHPLLAHLSLGTFVALKEIAWVRAQPHPARRRLGYATGHCAQ